MSSVISDIRVLVDDVNLRYVMALLQPILIYSLPSAPMGTSESPNVGGSGLPSIHARVNLGFLSPL